MISSPSYDHQIYTKHAQNHRMKSHKKHELFLVLDLSQTTSVFLQISCRVGLTYFMHNKHEVLFQNKRHL